MAGGLALLARIEVAIMPARHLNARRTLLLCGAYLLILLPLAGCASIPSTRYVANIGQGADSLTTVIGLNSGFAEGNPIVADNLWLLAAKPLLPFVIALMPDEYCRPLHRVWAHGGFGPAAHNVALMLGAPSPIAWGVLAISIPVLWDWIARGADEACTENAP